MYIGVRVGHALRVWELPLRRDDSCVLCSRVVVENELLLYRCNFGFSVRL